MKLLGFHVNHTHGGIPEMIATSEPPVVVVLDGDGNWGWLLNSGLRTKFLWRGYVENEPDFSSPNFDPALEGRRYAEQSIARMQGLPWDYVLGPNEPVIKGAASMTNLALFEIERAKVLRDHGYGAAIGSFSVGNPGDMSLLEYFVPAIDAVHRYKGVLSLHEYGPPQDIMVDKEWLLLRHRKFYFGDESLGWRGLPERYRMTPLVVTETGGDQLIYTSVPGGWRYHISEEEYLFDLNLLDLELLSDPYVIGSAIYCCGNIDQDWSSYDVWRETAIKLAGNMHSTFRVPQYISNSTSKSEGVDVSYAQGFSINWSEIKKKRDYAFVRSSFRLNMDSKFEKHYKRAKSAGLVVGMYHFLYDSPNPYGQGVFFAKLVDKYKPGLPPVVDVEIAPRNEGTASAKDVMDFVRGFKDTCSRRLFVYTNVYSWHRIMLGHFQFAEDEDLGLFVADWKKGAEKPRLPKPWKEWDFWQYTVANGIPGYSGRIDLNRFNGDTTKLLALYGANMEGC